MLPGHSTFSNRAKNWISDLGYVNGTFLIFELFVGNFADVEYLL